MTRKHRCIIVLSCNVKRTSALKGIIKKKIKSVLYIFKNLITMLRTIQGNIYKRIIDKLPASLMCRTHTRPYMYSRKASTHSRKKHLHKKTIYSRINISNSYKNV